MVLACVAIAVVVLVLTHTAPAPGLFDLAAGPRAIWQMPRTSPPTVYLTYDDGPNAATTPMLLDVLAREHVHATFFLIDREITDRTVPLVARMFADGHGVALHSDSRLDLLMAPATFARKLTTNADRIERSDTADTRGRPHRLAFAHDTRPEEIDYRLIGWGWAGGLELVTSTTAAPPSLVSRRIYRRSVVMHDAMCTTLPTSATHVVRPAPRPAAASKDKHSEGLSRARSAKAGHGQATPFATAAREQGTYAKDLYTIGDA